MKKAKSSKSIRYAVVGLGHIAQASVLPAFANARKNSVLAALVSDDPDKLRTLARTYRVPRTLPYEDYDALLHSGEVDAVYIALPNSLHLNYAVRAANAGIHVLCEKPLALDESECQEIIGACSENDVKLMVAYRLHFERANLEAIRIVQSGRIGEPRIFNSLFTMQVKEGNIRLQKKLGGGPLFDIGIYCVNAARYLFQAEPREVFAFAARNGEHRFREVDEMTSAILRFPEDRLASFTCSFGAADTAVYEVVGSRGVLRVTQAYEHSEAIDLEVSIKGRTQKRHYAKRDQFGPELLYFSDCILKNKEPEPSGIEGLLDVHIIQSLLKSAGQGRTIELQDLRRRRRPSLRQHIYRPVAPSRPHVHASPPTR
jgi:predicted dehydrogenase